MMMKIKFDQNNYVKGYCTLGDMEGATEFIGEIPEGFSAVDCGFYHLVGGELVLDENKKAAATQKEIFQEELMALYEWFSWYDNQVMQYTRAARLGEVFDKDMQALDVEAGIKQARIREIREILEG